MEELGSCYCRRTGALQAGVRGGQDKPTNHPLVIGKKPMRRYATRAGWHFPPGAQPDADGVNFSIFCRDAAAAELRLFDLADSEVPFQVIALAPNVHRTFFFWHVYVEGLGPGVHYTWRVAGPGQTLDSTPELLDPWARAVSQARWDRKAVGEGATTGRSLRAIVAPRDRKST